jgi:hypothetical protein
MIVYDTDTKKPLKRIFIGNNDTGLEASEDEIKKYKESKCEYINVKLSDKFYKNIYIKARGLLK